jgi:hypothetical protein
MGVRNGLERKMLFLYFWDGISWQSSSPSTFFLASKMKINYDFTGNMLFPIK